MKKFVFSLVVVLVVGGLIGVFALRNKGNSASKDPNVVSNVGIHWHPILSIYIKGQKQVIPADIGIGKSYSSNKYYDPMMSMTDIHTHDSSGKLHWEVMAAPVMKDHVLIGDFFEIWGQPFSSTQIMQYKNGAGGTVKMTVNGQPNTEFGNYQIHDGDQIVIRYE